MERKPKKPNRKAEQVEQFSRNNYNQKLTTNQGTKIANDENTLKAGERGPSLLEDFIMREKLSHFDRERIPERVVHARGYGVYGNFKVYQSQEALTKADFLQNPNVETPVFLRFSEVAGSKGAAETVRDVRGFAVKFYTEEGNFDLVGNNIPVFFIQDGLKFPDLIHAVKPEPNNEIPQAATAHDTFWDFIANNPESTHMMMWIMSDRTIPKSFRTMEGFGVHTFKLVNARGNVHFVKFHWKPRLGVHSLVWDESQKLGGIDPDFHRRDIWELIDSGGEAVWELGIQVIEEKDEFMFDFDILDATKLWPEEDVPVRIIGEMRLNRNVENVFAETEQVALHPGNIVPGIDFTNDPLLQTRLFSYTDTQMYRVGTNHQELPINAPICPFHNNQRDGAMRYIVDQGNVAYKKNSIWNNTPKEVPPSQGGFETYPETVSGKKIRKTAPSFADHYSQARLFWNSMSHWEKDHIANAFSFELGKVKSKDVRQQVVTQIGKVSNALASAVAEQIGVNKANVKESSVTKSSPALSMAKTKKMVETLKVGVLVADGFDDAMTKDILTRLQQADVRLVIISEKQQAVKGKNMNRLEVNDSFLTASPLLYDALLVVGGENLDEYTKAEMKSYVREQYMHYKPIAFLKQAAFIAKELGIEGGLGVLVETRENKSQFTQEFLTNLAQQRFFSRK
ncbi:catalase [Alkalihalobacillus xiaoxiensis]|uniref:Catalase n=1 Tax=Shouchella xiaoxiensis TaxID=766895 RepID=A0ABS2SYB1_9BACI|nr:catalase [Shouchella xiaoxiensis]MBM7840514.1 catalase [Shouchella xiaoxiensis]